MPVMGGALVLGVPGPWHGLVLGSLLLSWYAFGTASSFPSPFSHHPYGELLSSLL